MKSFAAGTTIGPYVVDAEIARGGMGAVYRARRAHDGAVVALKVLHSGPATTPEQRERFKREAQLAAGLVHPGIVRVHDAGEVAWLSFIAMDLIEGESLAARAGHLAPLEAAGLIAQVARAIEHAHAHGVIHRDLKPSNVLLRQDDGRALVTDFGVARHVESAALTRTGALVGTPTYLSPEQAAGLPATLASDVHALGAVLYELLTGLPPFRRDDLPSLLVAITTERPEPPSALTRAVPRALDRVCLAALAKSPAARPTAGAFAAALEAIVEGRPEAWRARLGLALPLASVVALVAVGLLVVSRDGSAPPPAFDPGAVTSTTAPAPTAEEPAWVEPPWLHALTAHGDAGTLIDALDALEADAAHEPPLELHAETRARAARVLADLDRRWTEPPGSDPGHKAACDRLAWIHLLWRRVEPAHRLPTEREDILLGSMYGLLTRNLDHSHDSYIARAGRVSIAFRPDDLMGYLLYAHGEAEPPWPPDHADVLAAGLALAAGSDAAWGQLAVEQALWLAHRIEAEAPGPVSEARRALFDLLREASARPDVGPSLVGLQWLAAPHAETVEEAQALVTRAEEAAPTNVRFLSFRVRSLRAMAARTGDRARLEAALRESEVVAGDVRARAPFDPAACEVLALRVGLLEEAGEPARALAALAPALAARRADQHALAGLSMRRAQLVARLGDDRALAPALDDLEARLLDHVARRRSDGGADLARVEAALADVRAVAAERPLTCGRILERLQRWGTRERLTLLDQR